MVTVVVRDLCLLIEFLYSIMETVDRHIKRAGAATRISPEEVEVFRSILDRVDKHCERLGIEPGWDQVQRFKEEGSGLEWMNLATYRERVAILYRIVYDELEKRKFVYIPMDRADYFEQASLFGKRVRKAFPAAAKDIQEAGTSLALGLSTAAVFHLMRATEVALRTLAKERKVRVGKAPVEYAEWQRIIHGIKKKVDPIEQWPRGPVKAAALEFYRGAIASFEGCKDAWRDQTMHMRKRYTYHDAVGIMYHVRDFMQRLATKLSESNTNGISWRRLSARKRLKRWDLNATHSRTVH